MSVKLIEIQDNTTIIAKWKFFSDGVQSILQSLDGEESEATILNDFLANKIFMRVVFVDEVYSGFVTFNLSSILNGKTFLNIVGIYLKKELPRTVLDKVLKSMEEFGEKNKCDIVRFITSRFRGAEKRLTGKGWGMKYMEFQKDIGGKNGQEQTTVKRDTDYKERTVGSDTAVLQADIR